MGINLARQSLGWTLLWSIMLLALFWGRGVMHPVELTASYVNKMPLGVMLEEFALSMPALSGYIMLFFVLLNAILITRIVIRNMIYTDKVFMPAIVYIAVACGSYFGPESITGVAAAWLMVCSADLIINSFRRQKQYSRTFLASVLWGSVLLIYAPAAVFIILVPAALVVFRKDWHETVIAIIGFILPITIGSYIYWGMGEEFRYLGQVLYDSVMCYDIQAAFPADFLRPDLLVFWGVTSLITIISILIFFGRASLIRTRPYKSIVFFIWMLVLSAALFVAPCRSVSDFPIIALPLSVIMPFFFNRQDGWITNVSYLVFILSIILYNTLPFFTSLR